MSNVREHQDKFYKIRNLFNFLDYSFSQLLIQFASYGKNTSTKQDAQDEEERRSLLTSGTTPNGNNGAIYS